MRPFQAGTSTLDRKSDFQMGFLTQIIRRYWGYDLNRYFILSSAYFVHKKLIYCTVNEPLNNDHFFVLFYDGETGLLVLSLRLKFTWKIILHWKQTNFLLPFISSVFSRTHSCQHFSTFWFVLTNCSVRKESKPNSNWAKSTNRMNRLVFI